MGDEFVGVPREDFRDLTDRVERLSSLLALLFLFCFLLTWALIGKQVITLTDILLPVPRG